MESPDEEELVRDLNRQRGLLKVQEAPQVKDSEQGINSVYLENSDNVILWTGSDLKSVSRSQDGAFINDLRFGNQISSI
jgi:hypothetical protein